MTAALLWHLERGPTLGASIPAATGRSWFVHKQAGHASVGVPEITVVYGFDADQLIVLAVRFGPTEDAATAKGRSHT